MLKTTVEATRGQVTADAAEIYDAFFVPAVFAGWAGPVADAAGVDRGDRVLDVACGTGVAAREAARRVGGDGSVTGLDPNPGMLAVARRRAPEIAWREGRAEALPFENGGFDAVLCQFGVMFFDDRPAGLREMRRVLAPGGRAVAAIWDSAETSPGWAPMIALIDRMFGREAADALRAPFAFGDAAVLRPLLGAGGWGEARVTLRDGVNRFPSIAEWVRVNVRGWALADLIDDEQEAALARAAEAELSHLIGPDGAVAFKAAAHLVALRRP